MMWAVSEKIVGWAEMMCDEASFAPQHFLPLLLLDSGGSVLRVEFVIGALLPSLWRHREYNALYQSEVIHHPSSTHTSKRQSFIG
jgi:hypothetical protein|eukprot:scaffold13357_cov194-Alexandrium_tamarense.AAC.8